MNRLIRLVLLYLLALALPVQGWAAATQTVCAPSMHQTGMQMTHDEPVAAMVQTHDHHQMHTAHHQADDGHAKHNQAAKADTHGKASCSVCAACYIGMALLPAIPDLVKPVYGSSAVTVAAPSFFPGHIPDGIKRPPRHILA